MVPNQIQKKKVLVVEDEPAISRACQRVLMAEGFEVDIAMNGLIAMQMVNENTYDLCLSDIRTPGMNGIELYRYLEKAHPELAKKVIFTTGDILSNNIEAFLLEVKRPYLPKPFMPDELTRIVKSASLEIESVL
jgi:DNA-binding NtrC family response regulator